jgi:hypothetical protein
LPASGVRKRPSDHHPNAGPAPSLEGRDFGAGLASRVGRSRTKRIAFDPRRGWAAAVHFGTRHDKDQRVRPPRGAEHISLVDQAGCSRGIDHPGSRRILPGLGARSNGCQVNYGITWRGQGGLHRSGVVHLEWDYLNRLPIADSEPVLQRLTSRAATGQYLMACLDQTRHQVTSDEPVGSGHQDPHDEATIMGERAGARDRRQPSSPPAGQTLPSDSSPVPGALSQHRPAGDRPRRGACTWDRLPRAFANPIRRA